LKYASSKVDYVVGLGLYMLPSDLQLRIGTISNYNNNIVIADTHLKLGINPTVNDLQQTVLPLPSILTPQPQPIEIDHGTSRLALTGGLLVAGLIALYYFK